MTPTFWRNTTFVLAAACAVLTWRTCRVAHTSARLAAACDPASTTSPAPPTAVASRDAPRARGEAPPADEPAPAADDAPPADSLSAWGVTIPGWVRWFAPQPGENLLAYRDRMVPLAQAAVAPHRARVARGRDAFAAAAHLDAHQRAELDAAVDEAATAIQDRVLQGLLSGDLLPAHLKPSTGVAFARDVLDLVARADRRFQTSLTPDQRAALATHPFDVADYLLFSTRWEDMLGVTE